MGLGLSCQAYFDSPMGIPSFFGALSPFDLWLETPRAFGWLYLRTGFRGWCGGRAISSGYFDSPLAIPLVERSPPLTSGLRLRRLLVSNT